MIDYRIGVESRLESVRPDARLRVPGGGAVARPPATEDEPTCAIDGGTNMNDKRGDVHLVAGAGDHVQDQRVPAPQTSNNKPYKNPAF